MGAEGSVMTRIVKLFSLLLLTAVLAGPASVSAQSIGATSGEITVYNESGFEVYIYISSSERGKLEPGYSKTFKVPLGDHRVEARTDSKFGKSGYKDFVITSTYPWDGWYVKNGDLN